MSKHLLFEEHEREMKERAECKDCRFNWDDKFWELCSRHDQEMSEAQAEADYFAELGAHRAQMMF